MQSGGKTLNSNFDLPIDSWMSEEPDVSFENVPPTKLATLLVTLAPIDSYEGGGMGGTGEPGGKYPPGAEPALVGLPLLDG